MVDTVFPIASDVSPLQFWKADRPMVSTELGIVKSPVNPVKPWKAYAGITFTFSPMVSVAGAVQPEKALPMETQLSALNMTEFNPLQLLKALLPMVRTELGMVNTPDIWLSPENSLAGMTFTLFPMVKDVTLMHPENDPIVQLSALNTMAEKLVQM